MVGNGNDLGWRVRSICGGSKGNTIFNLGNEDFNRFGWVIVRLHLDVVRDEVGRAETTIGSIQVLEKLSRCDVGESCDSEAESAQVHAVDTPDYLLLERVVGRVEFLEECRKHE